MHEKPHDVVRHAALHRVLVQMGMSVETRPYRQDTLPIGQDSIPYGRRNGFLQAELREIALPLANSIPEIVVAALLNRLKPRHHSFWI
uniref:hypothetical protein n=1 Tax=Paraburkholderia oxyphila TaxID=614212 RepID=UPI000488A4D2|nr:hypothetical protein [Paraburkholderia oxyphila]